MYSFAFSTLLRPFSRFRSFCSFFLVLLFRIAARGVATRCRFCFSSIVGRILFQLFLVCIRASVTRGAMQAWSCVVEKIFSGASVTSRFLGCRAIHLVCFIHTILLFSLRELNSINRFIHSFVSLIYTTQSFRCVRRSRNPVV